MIKIDVKIKQVAFEVATEHEKLVLKNVLVKSYQQYEVAFKERWPLYLEELKKATFYSGTDCFLVAELNNQIIGTAQLFQTGLTAYDERAPEINHPIIRFLAVDPLVRGQGVARKLLDQAINYGQNERAEEISLHTTEIMAGAIKLYEAYGFLRNEKYDYFKDKALIQCYTLKL